VAEALPLDLFVDDFLLVGAFLLEGAFLVAAALAFAVARVPVTACKVLALARARENFECIQPS
jgi:hypothetical protein